MAKTKEEIKVKEPVRIREKDLDGGETAEQEHPQACRADQGPADPRHPEGRSCGLGETEEVKDDAALLAGGLRDVYAKVNLEKKLEAVNLTKGMFD